jgi:renalase
VLLIFLESIMSGLCKKIAVLGSGISGSAAARLLAESGLEVTVFECGRGVGGRMATRYTRDEDKFSFDHGAQYISKPKDPAFASAMREWEGAGCVRPWEGRFTTVSPSNVLVPKESDEVRFVGYPTMNSISKHLLAHSNIDVVLSTRACATFAEGTQKWTLRAHEDSRILGEFDWLLSSDRLSATNDRADLRDAAITPTHFENVAGVGSIPSLVVMIAFAAPLTGIVGDHITFSADSTPASPILYAVRDSSKPGRSRDDGKECWTILSTAAAAQEIIAAAESESTQKSNSNGSSSMNSSSSNSRSGGDTFFEDTRAHVRETARSLLLEAFLSAAGQLSTQTPLPDVVYTAGHRWSAAFPKSPLPGTLLSDVEAHFVAFGDYYEDASPGLVEGAYLSGRAAAQTLLESVGGATCSGRDLSGK